MKKTKDVRAAEKYAEKAGGFDCSIRETAFLAGIRYGRKTAVEAVRDLSTMDVSPSCVKYRAIEAIRKRGRS